MKIGILGTGAFGCSLASVITDNGYKIMMWTPFEEEKKYIETHKTIKVLPSFKLKENTKITNNIDELVNYAEIIIIAIPAKNIDEVFAKIGKKIDKSKHICIASKGLEETTGLFIHEIINKYCDNNNISVISGPTFAIDLVNKSHCALTLAATNDETAKKVKKLFENNYLKLRINHDIIGTEICGAVKNVIAIASGMLDGLKSSESTRAMLLTEALHDMAKIIIEFGGSERTILSYAGFGDLLLTCNSEKSRNYKFGKLLAEYKEKEELEDYLKNNTAEGYNTIISINNLLKTKKIEIPILKIIYEIIIQKRKPNEILEFLIEKK